MTKETINLNAIIAEASALETITRQLENFMSADTKQEINRLEMA